MRNHNVTVVLGGKDLIVNTRAVAKYLTGTKSDSWEAGTVGEGVWKGDGLDVLWFPNCDHMQVFDKRRTRERLVNIIRESCVIA